MNGEVTLFNLLKDDSTFYGLLSTVSGKKALAVGIVEPASWGIDDTTASIYNAVGVDNSVYSLDTEITLNCRASTEGKARNLASAGVEALNIVAVDGGRYYCQTLGVIPPIDKNDAFNVPIAVTVKGSRELN